MPGKKNTRKENQNGNTTTLEDLLNNPEDLFKAPMNAHPANNEETDKTTK